MPFFFLVVVVVFFVISPLTFDTWQSSIVAVLCYVVLCFKCSKTGLKGKIGQLVTLQEVTVTQCHPKYEIVVEKN